MEIQPIISTLRRHKLIAILLALLVALTCGIVCNVAFMIQRQAALVELPSGVAENQLVTVESVSLARDQNAIAQHKTDLAALRAIPGVKGAAVVGSLPLSNNGWSMGVPTGPDAQSHVDASAYWGTPDELATLGLKLVAGRDFRPDEYVPVDRANGMSGIDHVPAAIITRALAARLFPGQNPLGKTIYPGKGATRIVGVVERLLRPNADNGTDNYLSMLLPMLPDGRDVTYLLRTAPQDRARVLKQAQDTLMRLDDDRVLMHAQTFTQMRAGYFQRNRGMIQLLVASALGMLLVTALGIAGLANFWVQQRTRTIGIRRAVGARRRDILRYFQTENFLIVSLGVVLGVLLAMGLNLALMKFFALPRMPLWYLPVGAGVLWLLGQLSVLAPALRASNVPPVVATRSV
ncbi:MAG TPA: FtsX-like permease family protein [Rhodanobacteraceae bacterium]|jgi:putative ABC transport system permease protein|nr:FtsX-like permease family protein [Rhodanobacteraceae bacterium]